MELKKREIQKYKKGEVIFREGDSAHCMYDILWGSVGIYANYGTGEEKELTVLRGDQFFGEMGMLDAYPRSATAVVLEEGTQLEIITADTFSSYLQEKPAKVLMIMQNMSQRIRGLTTDYLDACRAVSEAKESVDEGKEKSGWFKDHFKKFVDDFRSTRDKNEW